MTTQFDPVAFKTTTRAQWEEAAEAWHRWGPAIEDWLGAATARMLDEVRLTPGSRVLDVAAGAGGQTLAAARRVGPSGSVLATDISPTILEYAAKVAADAGLANVATLEADGSFRMILAHEDPGLPNWIDTEGRPTGTVFWRYFLPVGDIDTPQATVVKFADLKK